MDGSRDILDAHVVLTFASLHPDGGSEPGIGWNWLQQISRRTREVTAVAPAHIVDQILTDPRLPSNVTLVPAQLDRTTRAVPGLSSSTRRYLDFAVAARSRVTGIKADLAHQVTLGTPYWGSAIAPFPGPKVLGPVCISSPMPSWAARSLGARDAAQEVVRTAILRWPPPILKAQEAISAADLVLVGDRRSQAAAQTAGRQWLPMIQDGAHPASEVVDVGQRKDLVWAGRFMPRKGPEIAVDAFHRVSRRLPPSTRLVMYGDGPLRERTVRLARDLGLGDRVVFPGLAQRPVVIAHLAAARALVFTSLRESFGGVVLEAAERGTPTVVALHAGVSGLVQWLERDAAWSGPVTSRKEMVDVLAQGMLRAATCSDDEWIRHSQAAYSFAQDHNWDSRGERMLSIYTELLRR